jgi:radical SAM superfamily enzyme YgiQ (UPF0313 family)
MLINVPEIDFEEKRISYTEVLAVDLPTIPLGIASLSAYLKKFTEHRIHLLDIFAEGFDAFKEKLDRKVFLDLIEEHIRKIRPDIIGISALMIINYKWVHHVARVAKQLNPNVKVIVGGGYSAILPDRVLEDSNVDFITTGEGEEVLLSIIDADFDREKLASVDGIGFRTNSGEVIINRKTRFINDLDSLPFCDWEGIKLENYMKHYKDRVVSYITSRGCPFGCSFCSSHLLWGKKFRPMSAKRVLDEIDYLVKKYKIERIEFRDDNLALNKKRVLDIFNGFIDRQYNLSWNNPNAVAIATLDRHIIETFKKSGCDVLIIAIESGSEKVIKEIIRGKPVTKNKTREVCEIARDVGLKVQTAFMVGFPGETMEDIEQTKNFALELGCDWNQISIATSFPGTEMYKVCEDKGYFVKADNDLERYRYGFANIKTEHFDDTWIKEKAYEINIEVNFLRNRNFKDDPKYAIILFEHVLSRYPKHLIGILCLAYAYKIIGEMQNAEDTVKRALDLVEKEPEIFETYEKYIDNVNPIFDDFLSLLQTT